MHVAQNAASLPTLSCTDRGKRRGSYGPSVLHHPTVDCRWPSGITVPSAVGQGPLCTGLRSGQDETQELPLRVWLWVSRGSVLRETSLSCQAPLAQSRCSLCHTAIAFIRNWPFRLACDRKHCYSTTHSRLLWPAPNRPSGDNKRLLFTAALGHGFVGTQEICTWHSIDPIRAQSRASTLRIRALAARLTDTEMQHPVGEHWTVGIAFAHLAFWDRRVLDLLDRTERAGRWWPPKLTS